MKVVLLETLSHLGHIGDVVSVKQGYARNFLFPLKKAVLADERTVKAAEHSKLILEHKRKKARSLAEGLKASVEKEALVIRKKAGEDDKLFGSVTAIDIESALAALGHTVSRKNILLEAPIKKVGHHSVALKLAGGIDATVTVKVLADKPERQADEHSADAEAAKSARAPKAKGKKAKPDAVAAE